VSRRGNRLAATRERADRALARLTGQSYADRLVSIITIRQTENHPMALLSWKHGKSKEEAVAIIKAALKESGHEGSVTWSGTAAEARYGPFASVLHLRGEVTDDAVVIAQCGGLAGGAVLGRVRELLGKLFPGGEPIPAPDTEPPAPPADSAG
jgi:hypothetical protein